MNEYLRQIPRELGYDIRLFKQDTDLVDSIYMTQYTPGNLLYDLMEFYRGHGYHALLTRHFMMTTFSIDNIEQYIVSHFASSSPVDDRRYAMFLWGLLTPVERTRFINQFIIE